MSVSVALEVFAAFCLLLCVVFLAVGSGVLRRWYRDALNMRTNGVFNFDRNVETTTKLPIPVKAALCEHNWEVLDKATLQMPHEQKYVCVAKCGLCGVIDKTVESTSKMPPPSPPPPAPPCKHQWETVERATLEQNHESRLVVIMKCVLCGDVDKTTEVTSKPPPPPPVPPPPRSECRHKWVTDKTVTLDSAYEQMLKSIKTVGQYGGKQRIDPSKKLDLDLQQAPQWMFRKTHIQIRTCSLCGEIDKLVASNVEEESADEKE
jgi:hypothetical protein